MSITFYILVFLAVVFLLSTFFTVRQQTAVSIERFGKFESIRHSGLQMKIPIIDKIAARISLKIQQLDVMSRNQNFRRCVCKDKSIGAVCGYQRKSIRCYL